MLVALGGLTPSANGKRVVSDGDNRSVIAGPFAESKEVVAGFMILEVEDMDEAVAWVARAPDCARGRSEMEIRPLMGMAEFEAVQTPQTRAIRARVRAKRGA